MKLRFYLINLPKGSFLITFPCAAIQEPELPHTEKVPHSEFTPKMSVQISLQRRPTFADVNDSGSKIIHNTWRLFEADVSRLKSVIFKIN